MEKASKPGAQPEECSYSSSHHNAGVFLSLRISFAGDFPGVQLSGPDCDEISTFLLLVMRLWDCRARIAISEVADV